MKCEVCLERLEEYLDGELPAGARELTGAHLIACADCASMFATLTAEQELFDRYDREVEVPPFLWTRIAQDTGYSYPSPKLRWYERLAEMFAPSGAFASGVAIVLFAFLVWLAIWMFETSSPKFVYPEQKIAITPVNEVRNEDRRARAPESAPPRIVVAKPKSKPAVKRAVAPDTLNESDVLSSDLAYLDMDDRDTVKHVEQSQLLLRSIRNVPVSDADEEIDMTYDKELSRRLLNENIVLRRDAEMKAKFPTKILLSDLEPFLIDIANLPDHARPEEVRVIKERVQKTEIVAALLDYQDRARTLVNQD